VSEQTFAEWKNVNGASDTWHIQGTSITGTGAPTSFLRSDEHYENFILRFKLLSSQNNNVALLLHTDALPARGSPFPRGIKVQLQNKTPEVIGINGAKIKETASGGYKAGTASGNKAERKGKWIQYQVTSNNGEIKVAVDGDVAFEGKNATNRKGYLALASEGSKVVLKDLQIKELPTSNPEEKYIATTDEGFVPLFDDPDLSQWELKEGHLGHWTAKDWVIDYDGKSEEKDKNLWSKKEFKDFILVADIRLTREPEMAMTPVVLPNGDNALNEDGTRKEVELPYAGDTGIYLRGSSKNQINIGNRHIGSGEIYGYRVDKKLPAEVRAAVTPKIKADNPSGEWNRFIITMKGEHVSVVLNDQLVIDHAQLPGISSSGRIALQDEHADNNTFQFANLFIKEL
jgi:hypothetical protein